MAKTQNNVILEGYVGRKPELYKTQKGKEVLTFSLATSYSWKVEDGDWNTTTDWHIIVVHKANAIEWISKVVDRGSLVRIQGRLVYYEREDKFQQKRREARVLVPEKGGWVNLILSPNPTPQIETPKDEEVFSEQGAFPLSQLPFTTPEGDLK